MIPRSQRNLFSFGENDKAGTKAGKLHAGGALHANFREELGWGGGAHREWCSVGTRRWGTVVGVCLVPEGGVSVIVTEGVPINNTLSVV